MVLISFFGSAMFDFCYTEVATIATMMYTYVLSIHHKVDHMSYGTKRVKCMDSLQAAHSAVAAELLDLRQFFFFLQRQKKDSFNNKKT